MPSPDITFEERILELLRFKKFRPAGPRIRRDPDTGNPVLSIPLPEPEVMQNILQALKGVLSGY